MFNWRIHGKIIPACWDFLFLTVNHMNLITFQVYPPLNVHVNPPRPEVSTHAISLILFIWFTFSFLFLYLQIQYAEHVCWCSFTHLSRWHLQNSRMPLQLQNSTPCSSPRALTLSLSWKEPFSPLPHPSPQTQLSVMFISLINSTSCEKHNQISGLIFNLINLCNLLEQSCYIRAYQQISNRYWGFSKLRGTWREHTQISDIIFNLVYFLIIYFNFIHKNGLLKVLDQRSIL